MPPSPGFFPSPQDFASLRHSIASLRHSAGRSVHRSSILWTERPEKHRFAPNPGRSIHGINHPYTERPIWQRRNIITDRTNAVSSEQKELVCIPMAIAVGIGERIATDCTPKGSSAYRRGQKGLFCTPKAFAAGIGEQKVAVCTPLGRLRRRRNNSFRSGWRKRERHRSLDGELLLIRAARARNVRQTKRRHGLKRAAGKPAALSSMATAPCTGPPTSLFRQFAPELFLLRLRLPIICSPPVQSVADKRLIVSEKMKIGCVRLRNRL